MLTTDQLNEALRDDTSYPVRVPNESKASFDSRVNNHYDQVNAFVSEWSEWLHSEYGSDLTDEQHEMVYTKAYENGHAGGYSEIENEYIELADLATNLIRSVR